MVQGLKIEKTCGKYMYTSALTVMLCYKNVKVSHLFDLFCVLMDITIMS